MVSLSLEGLARAAAACPQGACMTERKSLWPPLCRRRRSSTGCRRATLRTAGQRLSPSRQRYGDVGRAMARLMPGGLDNDEAEEQGPKVPWVHCCLESYLDFEGTLRFRMFDTILL
eukprot:9485203-Pyramimonas_sp.AAC.1